MKINVIICTRNRSASLDRCLRSLRECRRPENIELDIIVVDNGSTDDTKSVVEKSAQYMPIRHLLESKPGLSNARNAGISAASGDYIVWTDDDVLLDPGWLEAYSLAFVKYSNTVLFGGTILPLLETPSPPWFSKNLDALSLLVGTRYFGEDEIDLSLEKHIIPFGANFAIRAAEQRQHLYDVNLGVAPGRDRGGEETTLFKNLLGGGTGKWIPKAKLQHVIPVENQSIKYVIKYFRRIGATWAFEGQFKNNVMVAGMPRFLIRQTFRKFVRYKISRFTEPSEIWIEYLKSYAQDLGALMYYRHKTD